MIPGGVRFWFTTAEAAAHARRHPDTVKKACQSGELHGTQRVRGGNWRIHRDCLEAWLLGAKCPHQANGVTQIRAARAS